MTTTPRRARRVVTGTLVAGALLLTACGGDDGGGSASSFCDQLEELRSSDAFAEDPDFTDPDAMRTSFEQARDALDSIGDVPSEIKDDFETVTSGLTSLIDLFEEYDYDLVALSEAAAADPSLTEQLENFGGPEFEAANDRLEEYSTNECGLTPDTSA
jgi:hypothetical protein